MAVRTRDLVRNLVQLESDVLWFDPPELKVEVERRGLEVEIARQQAEDGDESADLAGAELALAEATAALNDGRFPYKIRHISGSAHERAQAEIDRVRARWLGAEGNKQLIADTLANEFEDRPDEDVYDACLMLDGFGPDYCDSNTFSTPREMLQSNLTRIREYLPPLVDYADPATTARLRDCLGEIEVQAQVVQWDDFAQGFAVYLSSQEVAELGSQAEGMTQEELATRRDAMIKRHLKLEQDLRRKQVAKLKAEKAKRGREKCLRDLAKQAAEAKATEIAVAVYTRHLLAAMVLVPVDYDPADEAEAWRTGKWETLFAGIAEVEEVEGSRPDLYATLAAAVGERHPNEQLGMLVASSPFRAYLGALSG